MEFNFSLLVLASLAGMVAKLVVGWDPLKLAGSLMFVLLFLPLFGVVFQNDPQVVQEMANTLAERIVAEVPSVFLGEVAGVFAGAILGVARSLFKGW